MFEIDWLRNGVPVDWETSVLSESEAVAAAKSRAIDVAKRHPLREPDSFRLTDAAGRVVGVFLIDLGRWVNGAALRGTAWLLDLHRKATERLAARR
jgi:hypothetical protein